MTRRSTHVYLFFMAGVLLLLLPMLSLAQDTAPATEILWDEWGVPHIFARDNDGLFYAFGWAQAQNHADLILRLYGEARGRAAEYWGEEFVESDRLIHTLDITADAADEYANLSPEWRGYVDAFAAGFSAYADANRDLIADEREVVLPVLATDILAHSIRVLRYQFTAGRGLVTARQWANAAPQSSGIGAVTQADMLHGSNAWAVGPSRSASGNAMLVANPHQPWYGAGMWMEAHLVAPGVNVYGAALVGQPILGIAFNDNLGWTHTVNTNDGWDLYELTVDEANDTYLYDGEQRSFTTREAAFRVLQADGAFREETLTVRESVHGVVLAERPGQAVALRTVGENTFAAGQQWWEMGLAQDFEAFQAAISNVRIPMFTIMYADREGNILHLFNQIVPRRSQGDWAFWSNITLLSPNNPAILPGDDPALVWDEADRLRYDELPQVTNPDTGWLQNANEPPWTTTYPYAIDAGDYPPYIAPSPFVWPRPVVSMRLMYEDESITFDELTEYKQSTEVELARWVLDDLIAAASDSDVEIVQQAAEVLANWDRQANADSRGAVLFFAWADFYIEPLGFAALGGEWDPNDPFNTPRGLADPAGAVAALEEVATQLEALRVLGAGIDVAYGEIFRVRAGEYDLPANGGEDLLGTFRTLTFSQDDDRRLRATSGDSYQAIIEFGDTVRARVLLSHGNATQPTSPHFGDQLVLYAEKRFRDAWLTREDIAAHTVDTVTFEGR